MLKIVIIVFLHLSFVICHLSFAASVPTFFGDEVVVTALRVPRLKSTIPWNTEVITRQEIEESGAVKLGDVIRLTSGLSVKANGGMSSQIGARFRGSNTQQVLVLLNGSRINSPSLGLSDLGDILLTDVEKIEIVKAPLSSVYGADAVGGVINIITGQPSTEIRNELTVEYGEFSTSKFALRSSGPLAFFSAASIYSTGFRTNSDYKADDFNLRFTPTLGKTHLELGMKKYSAIKGLPGSLDYLTPLARQTDNNLICDLKYDITQLGLKLSLSSVDLKQRYQNPGSWPAIDTTTDTSTSITDVQKVLAWDRLNSSLIGLEVRSDKSTGSSSGYNEIDNRAVYLQ
ncbi:MAG: TonB-dependent receptor plug domain-containing protein, partial [bacterium]